MKPFNPQDAVATTTEPMMMAVKWYSGTERLDMSEIANALQQYKPGADVTVQTIELREEELWEVLYQPTIAPSSLSPGAFTLTYTNGGVWLDDTDELLEADGDYGVATYQKTVDEVEVTSWTCTWKGFENPPVLATPTCTLSNATISRTYREHTRAVRDARFRELIMQGKAKCLITGETDTRVLDVAHIHEVRHSGLDVIENGIVLRTDLHKLFDQHILTIDDNGVFTMDPILSSYKELFIKPTSIASRLAKIYAQNIRSRNLARKEKSNLDTW